MLDYQQEYEFRREGVDIDRSNLPNTRETNLGDVGVSFFMFVYAGTVTQPPLQMAEVHQKRKEARLLSVFVYGDRDIAATSHGGGPLETEHKGIVQW